MPVQHPSPMNQLHSSRRKMLAGAASVAGLAWVWRMAFAETVVPATAANRRKVLVTDFGATGNGVEDDTPAIASAVAFAKANSIPHVVFPSGKYKIRNSILLHSKMTYEAEGAVHILLDEADLPIFSSPLDDKFSPSGKVRIKGYFSLFGNPDNPNNHGILLHDYYSKIEDIEIHNCGGHGIFISERSPAKVTPSGNLVENQILNTKIFGCRKSALRVGHAPNSKLTDGIIQNLIINSASTEPCILINSAAGWNIQNIHTYGAVAPSSAVYLSNGNFTILQNGYIENFTDACVMLENAQAVISIHNILMKTGAINDKACVISFSAQKDTATINLMLSSIFIHHKSNKPLIKLRKNVAMPTFSLPE